MLGLGALSVLLLFFVPSIVVTTASYLFTPVLKTKAWFMESSASLPRFVQDRTKLLDEIATLRSQLSGAGGNQLTIDALVRENQELRSLLGYEEDERILAGVIARPHQLPYDVLMIDRGSRDGVVENAPVFIRNNSVIGIVRTVTERSSLVELVSTPGFTTTVFVIGPDVFTNAVGYGGGLLRIGVPQGIALEEGNLVVIPSIVSGIYGAIGHIESSPTQPEQFGYVTMDIPISSLRWVSVGTTPIAPPDFEIAEVILQQQRSSLLTLPVPDNLLIELDSNVATTSTSTIESIEDEAL